MSTITIVIPRRRYRTMDADDVPRYAGVLIRAGDPEGQHRYLLIKRADGGDQPGTWAFPGGTIEWQETPLMAALRECREETEINLRPYAHRMHSLGVIDQFETFLVNIPAMVNPRLNHEHTQFEWATHDDLPQPMHPGAAEVIRQLHDDYLRIHP